MRVSLDTLWVHVVVRILVAQKSVFFDVKDVQPNGYAENRDLESIMHRL